VTVEEVTELPVDEIIPEFAKEVEDTPKEVTSTEVQTEALSSVYFRFQDFREINKHSTGLRAKYSFYKQARQLVNTYY
jgi:hypothetical protein